MRLDMKEKALESLQVLGNLFYEKCLGERSVSTSTRQKLLSGMPEMDWEEKYKRSEALIEILSTSKTEQEVLDRAAQL